MATGLTESQQKELVELQRRFSMLEASLRDVLSDKQLTQQDLDKTEATLEQLQAFADDVVSYRSLGRAFVKAPLNNIREELKSYGQECKAELKSLSEKEAQIEKRLDEQKQNILQFIESNNLGHIVKFQDRPGK